MGIVVLTLRKVKTTQVQEQARVVLAGVSRAKQDSNEPADLCAGALGGSPFSEKPRFVARSAPQA